MLETLGQYKILDRVGAGGMGEVYRARDTRLGRTVAIKVLPADLADDPGRRERLMREAQAAAALSHPNIAALYEFGEDQGHSFLVFEFVPGETLKTVIAGHPLNPRRAVDLGIQIADALAEAHAQGIVHRDIEPDNVIITPKGNAKILDFGLATWTASGAARDSAVTLQKTTPGLTPGTVAYMSPEQALGQAVDDRTDIFSLGVVLFEMLTGRLPFAGATPTALALQIVQTPAQSPSSVNRSLPRELDAVVGKALAKNVDERYQAVTLAAELRSIATTLDARSGAAAPVTVAPQARRRQRTRATAIFVLTGVGVLCALPLLWLAVARGWMGRSLSRAFHAFGSGPAPMLAVVPLQLDRHDSDADQTFFADGLTEDLITRVGQTPGLKVIGRSATRAYRGRTPSEVAHELGAGAVLTGSVRPQGDTIKVSLELIDPADNTVIWTKQYVRELKDIFGVQAQVADDVAQALRVKLRPTAASARAAARLVDPEAYQAYLRGRQAAAGRHLDEAIALYEKAIAADAGLPEAFAGKAEAMHLQITFGDYPDEPTRRQQLKDAAERGYQLDPDLPQANLAMALVAESLSASLRYLRHAIEIDSSYGEGYHQIGDQIKDFDPERAIAFYRKSIDVDPRLTASRADIASTLLGLNQWADARRELEPLQQGGDQETLRFLQATIDLDEHQFDRALGGLRAFGNLRTTPVVWTAYITALRTAGRRDEAYQEAAQMLASFPRVFCEARGLAAGLRLERGQTRPARQLADPIRRDARGDAASPAAVRCAVMTAAAMNDAFQTATLLTRIASREDLLRSWALGIHGARGGLYLRGRTYPWVDVIDKPAVVAARARLDAAYKVERDEARKVLAGLLQP